MNHAHLTLTVSDSQGHQTVKVVGIALGKERVKRRHRPESWVREVEERFGLQGKEER